ncbi:MAG: gamma-glutamyltransferase [Planctomycetia bacterium]|nr:gamma-glutamyltransferase [Planctomycetia bacterium]
MRTGKLTDLKSPISDLKSLPIATLLLVFFFSSLIVITNTNCSAEEPTDSQAADSSAVYQQAAVAADHPLASEVGVEILRKGGNVVDAAAAVGFALSVLRPASSGLGGGGFMVIWNAQEQRSIVLDYRERAPLNATVDMFAADTERSVATTKDLPSRSVRGPLAAAVPGHVAGLCHAVEKYGRLPIADVVAPAIRLAREGVPADNHFVTTQRTAQKKWQSWPQDFRSQFDTFHDLYLNEGKPVKRGDKVTSPQLPALEQIAARGAAGFYSGSVAEALIKVSQQHGGLLTTADLRDMRPIQREPLTLKYHGYDVVTMPPPSSGGIALLTTLQILEELDARDPTKSIDKLEADSPEFAHRLTEAFKHTFADRAEFLGDADFVDVPTKRLISREHARELASRIDLLHTQPTKSYGRFEPVNDSGTTHFSIIDREGNAVACTETINTEYGSWIVDPKFGILLNNEMDDFAAVPGQPNAFGLTQSRANAIAPRKKPLSSMTPTIIVKDGKAVFAVGAAGGPRIITATTQVLLNLTRRNLTPAFAVKAPRLHHQWLPDVLDLEPRLFDSLQAPLRALGHTTHKLAASASCQAVSRSPDGLRAASDFRKGGRPAGY